MNTSTVISLGLTVCLAGCGGTQKAETTPIARQSSADEILRIAGNWTSSLPEEGLLSPPSAISLFKNAWTSQLDLKVTSATKHSRSPNIYSCATVVNSIVKPSSSKNLVCATGDERTRPQSNYCGLHSVYPGRVTACIRKETFRKLKFARSSSSERTIGRCRTSPGKAKIPANCGLIRQTCWASLPPLSAIG